MGPAARKALTESGLSADQIQATGPQGRITKGDVLSAGSHAGGARERRSRASGPSSSSPSSR